LKKDFMTGGRRGRMGEEEEEEDCIYILTVFWLLSTLLTRF